MRRIRGHGLVLGASIGGLLAARVLSERYERVTVVERDLLPLAGDPRRGVPQSRAAHGLLARGAQILEELLPGLLADLVSDGAPVARSPQDSWFSPGGHLLCQDDRPGWEPVYLPSRPFLEHHVRARVRALPNVEILDRTEATGLIWTGRDRVVGARVVRLDEDAVERKLSADLVVDATGRGARMVTWLREMGYPAPPVDRIEVDVKYASQPLRLTPGALGREKVVLVGATPSRPTFLALFEQEGGRHILSVGGFRGHHPPTDPRIFPEFARTLVPERIVAAIRDSEPLGDVVSSRFPASVRRRYESMRRFPVGILAVGDAICSFNPIYGQGMGVAALQALVLRNCLDVADDQLAKRFFRETAVPVALAWRLGTQNDLSLPDVAGSPPLLARVPNAMTELILTAAERDPIVAQQFIRIISFLDPPTSLVRPHVVGRTLRDLVNLRRPHRSLTPTKWVTP